MHSSTSRFQPEQADHPAFRSRLKHLIEARRQVQGMLVENKVYYDLQISGGISHGFGMGADSEDDLAWVGLLF